MTITVEDGTGVVGADSYAIVDELELRASSRGIDLNSLGENEKEQALRDAAVFMEQFNYKGTRYSAEQGLPFPRIGVILDGWTLSYDTLPRQLKSAQLDLALDIAQGIDLMPSVQPSTQGAIIEESVEGAVSVKYAAPSTTPAPDGAIITAGGVVLSRVTATLAPLLASYGQLRVRRG